MFTGIKRYYFLQILILIIVILMTMFMVIAKLLREFTWFTQSIT